MPREKSEIVLHFSHLCGTLFKPVWVALRNMLRGMSVTLLPLQEDKRTGTGEIQVYIDYLAKRVVDRTIGNINPADFLVLPDGSLLRLVTAAAADEWILLSTEITNRNETVLNSLGMTNSQQQISSIFNDVGEKMMSDEVLNRAVDLLKEKRVT